MSDVTRRDLLAWPALAGGLAALAGLVWAYVAPSDLLKVIATSSGPVAVPDAMQTEAYIAADGIAALLLGGVGLVLTIVIVVRWRTRPLVALVFGIGCGVVGALIFWWIVSAIHATEVAAYPTVLIDGSHPSAPRTVRMPAIYVLWPLVAALVVTVQGVILWVIDRPKAIADDTSDVAA